MIFKLPALAAVALSLLSATAAPAADPGGARVPNPVGVSAVTCPLGASAPCERGRRMTIKGTGMDGVAVVEFLGHRGARDNRKARPSRRGTSRLSVVVPRAAHSGRVRVRSVIGDTAKAPRPVEIVSSTSPAAGGSTESGVFPIRGRHDLGQSATNDFGGGRGHQGQDMFASCGTPLAAAVDAKVQYAGWDDRAGNYLVLQDGEGRSYVYMHMRAPASVDEGDRVVAGRRVGAVGQTGRAFGCHLHFEIWSGPGWYEGGRATDPLPQLKRWDADHNHR